MFVWVGAKATTILLNTWAFFGDFVSDKYLEMNRCIVNQCSSDTFQVRISLEASKQLNSQLNEQRDNIQTGGCYNCDY